MTIDIRKPVGMIDCIETVERNCCMADMYRHCDMKPAHLIVNMAPGNGRTTFTEYVADMYRLHRVRRFGGLESYLEFVPDGSMAQLQDMFASVRSAATYTNEYEGIVAIDLCRLSSCVNEQQFDYFLKKIEELSDYASFIFFEPTVKNRNVSVMMHRIQNVIGEYEHLDMTGYSTEELFDIVMCEIEENGVETEDIEAVKDIVCAYMQEEKMTTAKNAVHFARNLCRQADFTGFIPVLSNEKIKNYCQLRTAVKEKM